MANVESKSIPHELPSSHWLKATGQCVLERYLSATMSTMWAKLTTLESHVVKYGVLNFKFINFTKSTVFIRTIFKNNRNTEIYK